MYEYRTEKTATHQRLFGYEAMHTGDRNGMYNCTSRVLSNPHYAPPSVKGGLMCVLGIDVYYVRAHSQLLFAFEHCPAEIALPAHTWYEARKKYINIVTQCTIPTHLFNPTRTRTRTHTRAVLSRVGRRPFL